MAFHHAIHTFKCFSRRPIALEFLRSNLPLKPAVAFICSKELRDPNIKKPAPWPYKTKRFGFFQQFYDITPKRFDENTKVIVVEGNIGAGKTTFAKQLAEEFDMLYIPEPNLDEMYINDYGYDLRLLDPILPRSFKVFDLKKFYSTPEDRSATAKFQFLMFIYRYEAYIDALAHLLSTGQGIVMERSAFSDKVFARAISKAGYMRKEVLQLYDDIYQNCVTELLHPHLIIYLDVPVDILQERIKARNDPIEVGSKVLTNEYLHSIADCYTNELLPELEKHSELLIYDWSQFGDLEVVVGDIERMDFDKYGIYDKKLRDWLRHDHWAWSELRYKYTTDKDMLMEYAVICRPRISELVATGADIVEYRDIINKVPGMKFVPGFNPDMGDKIAFTNNYVYKRSKWRPQIFWN